MSGKTVIFCFLLLKLELSLSFQCPGYEIPLKHKCDGINNCGDNSDEKDCPFIGDTSCPSGCDCTGFEQCKWSGQTVRIIAGLPAQTPAWFWYAFLFQNDICDRGNRKVCCCGAKQIGTAEFKMQPKDCEWGPYKPQGECSKSCDGGVQTMKRLKTKKARHGGAECPGNSTKIEPCNEQACEDIKEVVLRQDQEVEYLDTEETEDYYAYDYEDYDDEIDCSIYGQAQLIIKETVNKKCSEYKEDGFRCVPFYSCKGGEIITDGRDILGVRGAIFNPLDSKCDDSYTDICCRHPDWKDVPLDQEIKLPPPVPIECHEKFTTLYRSL